MCGAINAMIKLVSGGDAMKNKALAVDLVLVTPRPCPSALPCAGPGRCLWENDFGASTADPAVSFPCSSLHLYLLPRLCFAGMLLLWVALFYGWRVWSWLGEWVTRWQMGSHHREWFPCPVFFANKVLHNLSSCFSFQLKASCYSRVKAYESDTESNAQAGNEYLPRAPPGGRSNKSPGNQSWET